MQIFFNFITSYIIANSIDVLLWWIATSKGYNRLPYIIICSCLTLRWRVLQLRVVLFRLMINHLMIWGFDCTKWEHSCEASVASWWLSVLTIDSSLWPPTKSGCYFHFQQVKVECACTAKLQQRNKTKSESQSSTREKLLCWNLSCGATSDTRLEIDPTVLTELWLPPPTILCKSYTDPYGWVTGAFSTTWMCSYM